MSVSLATEVTMVLAFSFRVTPRTSELARMVSLRTYMVTVLPRYSTGVSTLKVVSFLVAGSSTMVLLVVEAMIL